MNKKIKFTFMSLSFLLTIILLLTGINGSYIQAQKNPANNKSNEDIITDKKMQRLKSKIQRLEKRVIKRPDDLIPREALIRLRIKYLKKFDACIEEAEKQLKDEPDNINAYERKINLLKEKKNCAGKIKEDYSKLIDSMVKYLDDLRRRALRGAAGFEIDVRFMKEYEIERVIYEILNGRGATTMQRVTKEIDREKERCIRNNKEYIEKYEDEVFKTGTILSRFRDDYKEKLKKEISELKIKLAEKNNDPDLKGKYIQLLDRLIQQVEESLNEDPEDEKLSTYLSELKKERSSMEENKL